MKLFVAFTVHTPDGVTREAVEAAVTRVLKKLEAKTARGPIVAVMAIEAREGERF